MLEADRIGDEEECLLRDHLLVVHPKTVQPETRLLSSAVAVVDISGTWTAQDGTVFTIIHGGNGYTATYQGQPPHAALVGMLDGTFDGTTYSGTFTVTEETVHDSGTFTFTFSTEDKLTGTLSGSHGDYPVTLTRTQEQTTGPCVAKVENSFLYKRPAGTGQIVDATDGTKFDVGDIAETDANGEAFLSFGNLLIHLAPSSSCRIVAKSDDGSVGNVSLIKGLINLFLSGERLKDHPFQATDGIIATSVKGTAYSQSFDPSTQVSVVAVTEHSVDVTPTNPAFLPFTVKAGQQVQASPDGVSPVTPLPLTCAPTSGTSKKAGRAVTLKLRCTSTAAIAQTVSVSGESLLCLGEARHPHGAAA